MHELDRITHLLFSPASQFMIAKSDIKSCLCSVFADFQHVESLIEVCFSCASNEVERGWEGKGWTYMEWPWRAGHETGMVFHSLRFSFCSQKHFLWFFFLSEFFGLTAGDICSLANRILIIFFY